MSSDVTVVTVNDPASGPVVVSAGSAAPPTVVGALPSGADLSGARVVAVSDGSPSLAQPAIQLTDAPTIVTDGIWGRMFEVTLHGNRLLGDPVNLTADQRLTWRIVQDATGGRTLDFGPMFNINLFTTGPIVLSTAPHAVDYLGGIYRAATNRIDVLAFSPGF